MGNICMIGLEPQELEWLRRVVTLLRHPDPLVGELAREALRYLEGVAARTGESQKAG